MFQVRALLAMGLTQDGEVGHAADGAVVVCGPHLALEVGVVAHAHVGDLQAEHGAALAPQDAVPRQPRDRSVVP